MASHWRLSRNICCRERERERERHKIGNFVICDGWPNLSLFILNQSAMKRSRLQIIPTKANKHTLKYCTYQQMIQYTVYALSQARSANSCTNLSLTCSPRRGNLPNQRDGWGGQSFWLDHFCLSQTPYRCSTHWREGEITWQPCDIMNRGLLGGIGNEFVRIKILHSSQNQVRDGCSLQGGIKGQGSCMSTYLSHTVCTYRRYINVFVGVVRAVEFDSSIDNLCCQSRLSRLLFLLLAAQWVDIFEGTCPHRSRRLLPAIVSQQVLCRGFPRWHLSLCLEGTGPTVWGVGSNWRRAAGSTQEERKMDTNWTQLSMW